jgi:ornithine cyclodeaminase/alanine dehydrogenase
MVMDDSLLYLSEADVASAEIPLDRLRDAVAAVFAAQARGTAQAASKSVLTLGPGHVFQAKPRVMRAEGLAGMKWIGVIPAAPNGGQTISSLIVLSDLNSGAPVAVMGGDWITAVRTAAMTAIAAQKLARADSRSIGFLGCGVQARSHFDALRLVLPGLKELVACSRSAASAERFAAMARAAGLAARTRREPRQAVEGLDVVITTVPEGAEVLEFLDTAWVGPGAFVSAVDLARSWKRGTLRALDILATDEHEQTRTMTAAGRMTYAGPYEADLAELVSGSHRGRSSPAQRAMFNFSGHALADLAAAQIVYETAQNKGLGTRLAR